MIQLGLSLQVCEKAQRKCRNINVELPKCQLIRPTKRGTATISKACINIYTKDGRKYKIPCHRHGDAFYIISQFLKPDEIDKTKTEQGFLNSKGEFLDRYDAYEEALKCNQIINDSNLMFNKQLYSEMLW